MSKFHGVSWCEQHVDGEKSTEPLFQSYAYELKTTITFSGSTVYPLHINVMNLSKLMQHLMTIQRYKLPNFLSVQRHVNNDTYRENILDIIWKLRIIHNCISETRTPRTDTALRGIQAGTNDE